MPFVGNLAVTDGSRAQMLSQLNGAERTIGGFVEVIEASGWKIVEVRRSLANPSWWPIIVAAPV